MKQGLPRILLGILMSSILNLATIGCSSETPLAPVQTGALALSHAGRSQMDNSVRFVGIVVNVDAVSRTVEFSGVPAKIIVADDAILRGIGPSAIGLLVSLKELGPGMYIDAEGQYLDRETILLNRLTIVAADRFHSGFERTPEL